jgi:hypothetical protein
VEQKINLKFYVELQKLLSETFKKKKNSMARVRERTILTERPPLLGEMVVDVKNSLW